MCDIFPVFQNFCICVNLKIGMLIIAILAIITGTIMMSVSLQRTHTTYKDMMNVTSIRDPKAILGQLSSIIRSAITAMSAVFMFTGAVLLFATLTDQEGLVQVFVWVTFANVLFGLVLVLGVMYECLTKPECLLSGMDWLSGAAALVFTGGYLVAWLYFISVANSYVVQIFS